MCVCVYVCCVCVFVCVYLFGASRNETRNQVQLNVSSNHTGSEPHARSVQKLFSSVCPSYSYIYIYVYMCVCVGVCV